MYKSYRLCIIKWNILWTQFSIICFPVLRSQSRNVCFDRHLNKTLLTGVFQIPDKANDVNVIFMTITLDLSISLSDCFVRMLKDRTFPIVAKGNFLPLLNVFSKLFRTQFSVWMEKKSQQMQWDYSRENRIKYVITSTPYGSSTFFKKR